jgi:hypothetical protein
MTKEQFDEFVNEVIPQQLFHVDPADIDDESGAQLDEVILVGLIANTPACLKYKPLQWFLDTFLIKTDLEQPTLKQEAEFGNHLQGQIEEQMRAELEQQFLQDDMIGSDDFFSSSEEELFRKIQEDERNENEGDFDRRMRENQEDYNRRIRGNENDFNKRIQNN